jgi:dipeptidyl aminopeptidase/acylaminoacyl peptidase
MKLIILLYGLMLSVACQSKQSEAGDERIDFDTMLTSTFENLSQVNLKIAFIEANKDYSMNSDEKSCFGEIYVFDYADSILYKLTDDCYYETCLSWSPDGKKLLFGSTRDKKYKHDEPDMTSYPDIYVFDLLSNNMRRINNTYKSSHDLTYFSGLFWLNEGIIVGDNSEIIMINEDGSLIKNILSVKDSIYISRFIVLKDEKYIIISYSLTNDYSHSKVGLLNILTNNFSVMPGNYALRGEGPTFDSFLFGNRDSLFLYKINSGRVVPIDISGLGDTLSIISAYYINSKELICNLTRSPFIKGKLVRNINLQGYIGVYSLINKSIYFPIRDSRYKTDLILYHNE